MCYFIPLASVSRCSSSSLYIHSSYFRRKYMVFIIRRSFMSPSTVFRVFEPPLFPISFSNHIGGLHPLNVAPFVSSNRRNLQFGSTTCFRNNNLRLQMPTLPKVPKISFNARKDSLASGGFFFGLWLMLLSSGTVNAQASMGNNEGSGHKSNLVSSSHGKEVYTDYSVTGIPGDGRCLFRSVIHGACIRAGKSVPNETLQRELADELRALVADEFIKRREETEWFIEGSFDDYVSNIRRPHVWGGEPELHMASHVLRMPISVYIYDDRSDGLISIAEYGQEYGKEDPIQVLYDGFGHYDALQIQRKSQKRIG